MAIKWGVIGTGGIADRRTIPEGIIPAKNAELVAVMDIDETRTATVAQKYGNIKAYTSEEELLNDPNVEAVYIATPSHLHCRQTCLAAAAKKHVLCEKPMAMNIAECREMVEACRANGVKLSFGFMMRFHTQHQQIKKMIDEGQLGQLVMARAQLSCWYPPMEGAWRQAPQLGGGGSLIDMGSHCIDLLEMLVGKISKVSCFTSNRIHSYQSEDSAMVLLQFENGAQGIVDSYFNIPDAASKNRLEIYGSKGSILASGTIGQASDGNTRAYLEGEDSGYQAQQARADKSGTLIINPKPDNIYQSQIEHFSRCIEKNESPQITADAALRNLKIILACYEAAKSGKVLKV